MRFVSLHSRYKRSLCELDNSELLYERTIVVTCYLTNVMEGQALYAWIYLYLSKSGKGPLQDAGHPTAPCLIRGCVTRLAPTAVS